MVYKANLVHKAQEVTMVWSDQKVNEDSMDSMARKEIRENSEELVQEVD